MTDGQIDGGFTVYGTYTDDQACSVCRGPIFLPIHDCCGLCRAEKVTYQSADGRYRAFSECLLDAGHQGPHSWEAGQR